MPAVKFEECLAVVALGIFGGVAVHHEVIEKLADQRVGNFRIGGGSGWFQGGF